jgi:hypothetical protein
MKTISHEGRNYRASDFCFEACIIVKPCPLWRETYASRFRRWFFAHCADPEPELHEDHSVARCM